MDGRLRYFKFTLPLTTLGSLAAGCMAEYNIVNNELFYSEDAGDFLRSSTVAIRPDFPSGEVVGLVWNARMRGEQLLIHILNTNGDDVIFPSDCVLHVTLIPGAGVDIAESDIGEMEPVIYGPIVTGGGGGGPLMARGLIGDDGSVNYADNIASAVVDGVNKRIEVTLEGGDDVWAPGGIPTILAMTPVGTPASYVLAWQWIGGVTDAVVWVKAYDAATNAAVTPEGFTLLVIAMP